jgi:hypothetical protein
MNTLTQEQLRKLTELVRARLEEFEISDVAMPSRGVVRLIHDTITEWQRCDVMDTPAAMPATQPHEVTPIDPEPEPEAEPVAVLPAPQPVNGNGYHLSAQAKATLGPEHTVVTPLAERKTGRNGNVLPSLAEIIAEVRHQSMGGMMPSMAVFDEARPANWATASAHLVRLGLTWEGLANEAGLKMRPRKGT